MQTANVLIPLQSYQGPEVIKPFFILNSAEHEIFSANEYESANKS